LCRRLLAPALLGRRGGRRFGFCGRFFYLFLRLRLDNDAAGASLAAYALPNRIDIKIVEWLIATGSYDYPYLGLSSLDELSLLEAEAMAMASMSFSPAARW